MGKVNLYRKLSHVCQWRHQRRPKNWLYMFVQAGRPSTVGGTLTVSVGVSVLTLTFISVDRWYAICFPLKFKSTTGRAKTAIIIIWLLALAVDIPELMVLQTQHSKELRVETLYFTQCGSSWSERSELTFHILKAVLLYTVPLVFMSVAYCQIVMVLWRSDNIPGHTETMNYYGTAACNS
ncbi:hypothetical protein Cfor_08623, partial [Coptotermes formosanus]